ncbi:MULTISPECIES: hypothetical protein [Methylobacterium]|uniref:FG-GAP repeat protein n=1 Tax=Methylobacterium bullatum TaxID=570505 RepID=A0A679KH08_9HYPH|nr:hypothetical protein [Methylobacterium sp. WL19]TXN26702.1 hypothetical protein FV220_14095 [Methylobacterium sp. WL19]CAA2144797.1 hypothetical protein MBLL_03918 [Methylobacterium bullatum]
MSERGALSAFLAVSILVASLLGAQPVRADPVVTILDLPFRARAMRGPGSEVSLAVATSGLLPLARPKGLKGEVVEDVSLAVLWGDEGGAALTLADGKVATTLLGVEAIDGLAVSETPRGAVAGTRRATLGPLSAHLSDPVRPNASEFERAGTLTIRERQPVGMSADPKPVPIVTTAVTAGHGAAFALRRPIAILIDGRPVIVAVTAQEGGSALVVVGKPSAGLGKPSAEPGKPSAESTKSPAEPDKAWAILARSPVQAVGPGGQSLTLAAIGDVSKAGQPRIAAVAAPDGAGILQLWAYEAGALRLVGEATGYTTLSPGEGGADLSAVLDADGDGVAELALPVADRSALAILSLKDGIREVKRIPLPGLAAFGVAAIGHGPRTRLLVGLADGRVALISP